MVRVAVLAGTAEVEVRPSFPGWNRRVRAGIAGPQTEAAGVAGGRRAAAGFERGSAGIGAGLARTAPAVAGGLMAVGTAAATLGFKAAAAQETTQIAFTTMLGDADKARRFLAELSEFAARTPFEMPQLQTAAQSLVSVGIGADKVIPIMTTLGNVTSGMGTGSEGIKRATVAIQQMSAAQKISAEDLNQLRDAGIPVYELLSKATGKSTAEISKMRDEGKLGKRELEAMMRALETGKGLERFNGMMDAQSKTLAGRWATLKDTATMGLAQAVKPLMPMANRGLVLLTNLIERNTPRIVRGVRTTTLAVQGLWTLLTQGRATRPLEQALGWKKSDSTVKSILTLRRTVIDLFAKLRGNSGAGTGSVLSSLADGAGNALKTLPALGPTLSLVGKGLAFMSRHTELLGKALPPLLALWVAYRGALALNNVLGRDSAAGILMMTGGNLALAASNYALARSQKSVQAATATTTATENVGFLTRARTTVATLGKTIAEKAGALASKAYAGAQWLVNAALSANPIGLVVVGLLALGAAMFVAYRKSETFRNAVNGLWAGTKRVAGSVVSWMARRAAPVVMTVFRGIGRVAGWLWRRVLQPVFRGWGIILRSVFGWLQRRAWPVAQTVFRGIGRVVGWLWNRVVRPHFTGMFRIWSRVFSWLKNTGWPTARRSFQLIGDKAKWLYERGIRDPFSRILSLAGRVRTGFGRMKDGVKSAFGKIPGLIEGPLGRALGFVNNRFVDPLNGLLGKVGLSWRIPHLVTKKQAYASGGVMGGYTPGRDVHRFYSPTGGLLDLSGGEAVMRPEWTRAVGAGTVHAWNAAARRGGTTAVRRAMGFARGGVWDGAKKIAGDAYRGAKSLVDVITDPAAAIRKAVNAALARFGTSMWSRVAVAALRRTTSALAAKAKSLVGLGGDGVPAGISGGGGQGWRRQWAWVRKRFPGAVLTSAYRPGSITSTGGLSYHAQGRAIDVSPDGRIFEAIRSTFGRSIKELIFSPKNGRQIKNGANFFYGEPVRGDHWDHVHWAMNRGGVIRGYASGVRRAPRGPALVGEAGPELLDFRGGERVRSHKDTLAALRAGSAGPQRIVGRLRLVDGEAFIEGVVETVLERDRELVAHDDRRNRR